MEPRKVSATERVCMAILASLVWANFLERADFLGGTHGKKLLGMDLSGPVYWASC